MKTPTRFANQFKFHLSALVFALALQAPQVFAEEFLGIVSEDEINEPASQDLDPPAETYEPDYRRWTHTIGLGGNLETFQGHFISSYHYNRYVRPEMRFGYLTSTTDKSYYTNTSAEFPLIFYLANPTLLWPYLGFGPGYERWAQAEGERLYDDSYSLTGFHILGVQFKLSKHFSMVVEQKTAFYVNNTRVEKILNEGESDEEFIYEDQIAKNVSVNFYLSF